MQRESSDISGPVIETWLYRSIDKKFIFAAIRKSARGRDYEEAIQWLSDADLIHKSYLVESPKFPLSAYAHTNIFKIFLVDVGLLGAQSNLSFHFSSFLTFSRVR